MYGYEYRSCDRGGSRITKDIHKLIDEMKSCLDEYGEGNYCLTHRKCFVHGECSIRTCVYLSESDWESSSISSGINLLEYVISNLIDKDICKCQICEDGETEFVCIECTKSLKAAEEDIRAGRLTKWIPLYDETKCKRVGDKHCKDHNDGYYCEYCILG